MLANHKWVISLSLRIILSALFLTSALLKLFPVAYFEYTIANIIGNQWIEIQILARFIISLELILGIAILFNLYFRQIVFPVAILLLLSFSSVLAYQMALGFQDNCGCFGMAVSITPITAIVKNVVTIVLLIILLKINQPYTFNFIKIVFLALSVFMLVLPNIIDSPEFLIKQLPSAVPVNKFIDLEALYTSKVNEHPKIELRKGKHIIAFFSLSCKHCKLAAMKLQVIAKAAPQIFIYMILNGDQQNLSIFLNETNSHQIPHILFNGPDYVAMSGYSLPAIYFIDKSMIRKKIIYQTITEADLKALFN